MKTLDLVLQVLGCERANLIEIEISAKDLYKADSWLASLSRRKLEMLAYAVLDSGQEIIDLDALRCTAERTRQEISKALNEMANRQIG